MNWMISGAEDGRCSASLIHSSIFSGVIMRPSLGRRMEGGLSIIPNAPHPVELPDSVSRCILAVSNQPTSPRPNRADSDDPRLD